MEWLLPLILQIVIPTDSLMQVTLNKSLAQVIQEQIDPPPISWTPGYATAALASYSAGES